MAPDSPPSGEEQRAARRAVALLISRPDLAYCTLTELLEDAWLAGRRSRDAAETEARISVYRAMKPSVEPSIPYPDTQEPWISVPHTRGEHPCGSTAFYLTQIPDPTKPARLELLRIFAAPLPVPGQDPQPPLWRQPLPADSPICATCQQRIDPYTNQDIDWQAIFTTPREGQYADGAKTY